MATQGVGKKKKNGLAVLDGDGEVVYFSEDDDDDGDDDAAGGVDEDMKQLSQEGATALQENLDVCAACREHEEQNESEARIRQEQQEKELQKLPETRMDAVLGCARETPNTAKTEHWAKTMTKFL